MDNDEYKKCACCNTKNLASSYKFVKGVYLKSCNNCLEKSKERFERSKCIHKKQKSKCKECGGSSICIHNKYIPTCKECGGSSFCIHNKLKTSCKDCGGSRICAHNKHKSICKECNGSQICMHNKMKTRCKECGGGSICIHNKRKSDCRECGGGSICMHDKRKSHCIECDGSSICIHQRHKSICKECGGSKICIHKKIKSQCKECSPQLVMINIVRQQVYRTFKNSNLKKINHSIEYLGCDTETLKEHFKKKMKDDMTFDNVHIDHIKPVSRFNLENEEELLKCCHFTNLQPLLVKDNLELNNKWSEENELFWNKNIIYKPDFDKIYKL